MTITSDSREFSTNHFLLKPEEAGFVDLVHLLFSKDVCKRKFIECSIDEKLEFSRRWVIFVSIVVQLIFMSLKKKMACTGELIETFLNLPSNNRGVFGLLKNIIRGKVVLPERESASFTSVIGNLDQRVQLDNKIKHGDARYNASLSMMASKLSYENAAFIEHTIADVWKMEFLRCYDCANAYTMQHDTRAIIFKDKNLVVVAFRGTRPFDADAWCTDFDISWYELKGVGKIHDGFMKALGLQNPKGWPKNIDRAYDKQPYAYYKIRDFLKEMLAQDENIKFVVTGHSLGGALAVLFMAVLAIRNEKVLLEKLEGVYTFGQPRVGDKEFGKFMEEKMRENKVNYYRYVYCNDLVPRVPFDDKTLLFKHFGLCQYYNSFFYKGKVVEEEPNKNYFSLLWFVPKILNAVWEIIRSLILPLTNGRTYMEGWLLILFRIVGILIPGLSAHGPQDYVNLTRIGFLASTTTPASTDQQKDAHVKFLM